MDCDFCAIRDRTLLRIVCLLLATTGWVASVAAVDDIGGDDVTIAVLESAYTPAIAIASNGDIYVAVESHPGPEWERDEIRVYRSRDGGETWHAWGEFAVENEKFSTPVLCVAEGTVDRCFLAYTHYTVADNFHVCVAYSDLASPDGDWTSVPVETSSDLQSSSPTLACDHLGHDGYYLYVAFVGYDLVTYGPCDIWFARSVDQGETWLSPYVIGNDEMPETDFLEPSLRCGFDDHLHVTWKIRQDDNLFDEAVFYRGATNRAAGGLGAWSPMQQLTATDDGMWDRGPQVAASPGSPDVMIVYKRLVLQDGGGWELHPAGVFTSHDAGATFANGGFLPGDLRFYYSLVHQPTTGGWVVDGNVDLSSWAIQRTDSASPPSWSPAEELSDDDSAYPFNGRIAADPSRGDRIAAAWVLWEDDGTESVVFDAEWRRDPGYPNLEAGFPLDLDHMPISPPGLVDLDGDGDLEIVYGSNVQSIHAYHHDGSQVAGWPVDVGHFLTDGPVAVGDLRGDGTLYVVAGTMDGLAVAYLADGQPASGWPFDSGTGEPTYVSIGALGGADPRSVVVAAGTRTTFASWQGTLPAGAFVRNHYFRTHHAPCAIGDIDGDGINEVVGGPGDQVLAFRMCYGNTTLARYLPSEISDAITLVDLDDDGDVEILAPTTDGTLFAMYGSGADCPGAWPFTTSTASPLTSVAIARCADTEVLELAVGSRLRAIHLLAADGVQRPGFPVFTGEPWDLYGAPILSPVAGDLPDIVIADRANLAWSWNDLGDVNPGFPRDVGEMVIDSPALGDLDLDGSLELVVLTGNQMRIFDLNRPVATLPETWAMYGHDPQRTGCADGLPEGPTPVPGGEVAATRVSFAPPHPNPLSGPVAFRFAVPVRMAVSLDIFDLRGRRIATVVTGEQDPGPHVVDWDGRDQAGHGVAAGHYLARLQVRAGGMRQTLTRKLTILH